MKLSLRTALAPLALVLALLASPGGARADECGNVTTLGTCLDSKTLVWCDASVLRTQVCPEGEICVADDRFQGGFGCIATQYTSCGGITAAGECAANDQVVVWCDVNRVRARQCGLGLTCAWVEADGGYDCVPVAATADPDPESDAGGGDADATSGEDAGRSDASDAADGHDDARSDAAVMADSGAVPSVEQGGAGPAESYRASGGAGCAGGSGGAGWPALVLVAAAWFEVRRRARA